MSERSIAVRLRLNVLDFQAGARTAASSLDELVKKSDKTATSASTGLGRLQQSVKLQSQEWQTVSRAAGTAGTAMLGVGLAVAKTGVEYNNLQQSSRAALATLLGGATQANAQMDKLDEFARTSPFAKQTFIKAQQQMLAFGIESKKVIPYLTAIQDSVAAAGGSNNELEQVAFIISKIGAAGKITATDLMQLGQRGINAADLIGKSMGKSGQQIRAEITAGTLDAGDALDALAKGMEDTYGGAAKNVKNTFAGALDRVKGAWRDLSSALTEPFVGKEGGGVFTTLLNQVADFLRTVEGLPAPVLYAGEALGGLSTAALLGVAAFPKVISSMTYMSGAVQSLASAGIPVVSAGFGKLNGVMGKLAPMATKGGAALGAVAVGLALANVGVRAEARKFEVSINDIVVALHDLDSIDISGIFKGMTVKSTDVTDMQSFGDALRQALDPSAFASFGMTLDGVLGTSWSTLTQFQDRVEEVGDTLAGMDAEQASKSFVALAQGAKLSRDEFGSLLDMMPGYKSALIEQANALGISTDDATLLALATGKIAPPMDEASGAIDGVSDSAKSAKETLSDLVDKLNEAAGVHMSADEAQGKWGQQLADNAEALKKLTGYVDENGEAVEGLGVATTASKDAWDLNTEAGRLAQDQMIATSKAAWDVINTQKNQGASETELQVAMATSRQAFIDTAKQMGLNETAANALADEYGLIPSNLKTTITAVTDEARRKIQDVVDSIAGLPLHKTVTVEALTYATTYAQTIYSATGTGAGTATQRRATGGAIYGPGSGTSDDVLMWGSNGEHMWTASEVVDAGGQGAMYALRSAVRRDGVDAVRRAMGVGLAGGGAVGGGSAGRVPVSMVAPSVSVSAPAVSLPSSLTVVDEGGSFLGTFRVVAQGEIRANDRLNAGWR